MAAHAVIADDLLSKLAEDIETGEQMKALGRTLGFRVAEINRYTETNRIEGRVTCKGTRDMLFDWRQTVVPCDQHIRLEQALIDAELVMLADTHLKGAPSIQDISSKQISPSLTVQQCREKLKNKYLNQLCKIPMKPWDKNDYAEFKDMHTVVTMVKKDARGQDTNKKEKLQGSVAEIFSTKVNESLPARILISAPAGRGKTTAVAKIAYDWVHREKGSALEHLPLLFVVKFRNTSQRTSIGEAIKSQLLSDVDDLTPEGLESFIRENQGICHIILDGLDEYAGISSSDRGSESNIVSVIRWEEFPECRVLVTTRPHLENFFNQDDLPTVYTKMWIEGFSQESSREYIDKFFASTSNPCRGHGHGLNVYLDEQPLINELVKTPLFCLMVCHLWSEERLNTKTATQTKLLDNVNVFLMHHANARLKSRVKITLKQLRKVISQLGEVALTGLLDDAKKLVFTPHDFRKVPAILGMACELGIVSKTTVYITGLPQSNETTSNAIEFYHKLAQEHSAGKFLADQTHHFLLRLKISKLDTVLLKIKANISDYENLIRFVAGTDNSLCIRIMEALLSNSFLDESERYRILLDCSSETTGAEGNVSSMVQRCVTARRMVLKSPTVYTIVGMINLPKELKNEVRTVKFEGSTLTTDLTSGLWSCLKAFLMLETLIISDSSLCFPPSPPELPSVTKLSAERVTSLSYERVLSSLPGVREIDVSIDVSETSNNFQITTASRPMGQTRVRDEQFFVHISLHAWQEVSTDRKIDSGESIGLSLLFGDQTRNQHRLHVSGVKGRDEEALVDLFVKTKQLTYLNSGNGGGSPKDRDAVQNTRLQIQHCQLSTEMTKKLWSCLRSFASLKQLSISDSTLCFPPSPPELPSVTKLLAERVTSQSYERVLSLVPGVREIDASIDVTETSNTFQITTVSTPMGQTRGRDEQFFVHIKLQAWPAINTYRKIDSGESIGGLNLLFGDQSRNRQRLHVSGVKGRDEEALVDLFVKTKHLTSLNSGNGGGSLNDRDAVQNTRLEIQQCQLTNEMTEKLWFCLRSFTSLNQLSISDSSLCFPPSPPELPSVTKLSAERMTSQSYEGVLSSVPSLEEIDITIGDEKTENISQIQTSLRRHLRGQSLTCINPNSFASEGNVSSMSRKKMRKLGLLITACQAMLSGVVFGLVDAVIDDVQSSTRLMTASLYVEQFSGSLNSDKYAMNIDTLKIKGCQLSTEITGKLWSSLRSFTSLNQLSIADSSICFPPSPPELPSVTKLSAYRVTSQFYEGVLSSVPGVREIDVSIDVTETSNTFQITTASRPMGQTRARDEQFFVHIRLHTCPRIITYGDIPLRPSFGGLVLLFGDQITTQQRLHVSGVNGRDEEALVDLFVKTKHLTSLNSDILCRSGGGSLNEKDAVQNTRFQIQHCQLSTEMTEKLWSCLRSFTSLKQLSIADSSLSFPPSPPELPSVKMLTAEGVTSHIYEGVLSLLPGVREIDVSIDVAETSNTFQITTASRPMGQTRARREQLFVHIKLQAWQGLITDRKIDSGESTGRLSLLFGDQTRNQQRLDVSGVKGRDEEALVDMFVKTKQLTYLNSETGGGSLNEKYAVQNTRLQIQHCQLSTEMTEKLWSSLRYFTSLKQLSIADSSLSFPPSPPELPSVKKLSAEKVTSEIYKRVLSSLTGVREIDVSIDVAERSDTFQITTASRPMGQTRDRDEQFFVHIILHAWPALTTDRKIPLRPSFGGISLLFRDQTRNQQRLRVSGVKGRDDESWVDMFVKTKQLTYLNSESGGGSLNEKDAVQNTRLEIQRCQLSTEMTEKLWSSLRSFTSLKQLSIADSSLKFPPSPPKLSFVTKVSAERVTSQSYEGLISSVPGVREIDITFDDADTDIAMITASIRRTQGQQLTHIRLEAASSLPSWKTCVSRETMRGLGYLIRDQTKNLQWLGLSGIKCLDEEDLVEVVELSAYLKSLDSLHLQCLDCGSFDYDRKSDVQIKKCHLSTELTVRMWSCLKSFTSVKHFTISDSSLSFPPSPLALPFVTKLSAKRVTSQSYEGLLSSLPGLRRIDITIDDAERDIPQLTTCLCRIGGQHLTHMAIRAPSSLPSEKESVSKETMRGLYLLITDQTKNLQVLELTSVKCTDEQDLVNLTGICSYVKTMSKLWFEGCGSTEGGRLERHLTRLDTSTGLLGVWVMHGIGDRHTSLYRIKHASCTTV